MLLLVGPRWHGFAPSISLAAMFSTGSIVWISSTLENNFDNDVAQIMRNLIRRFLDPKPFPPVGAADVQDVDRAPAIPEYDNPRK